MAREETQTLLTDAEIARWFGVGNAAVSKWRAGQNQSAAQGRPRKTPAFKAIADALGVELPGGAATPKEVVEAFGKAVGYLDERGDLIPEIQNKPKGRWLPVRPTIDPVVDEKGQLRKRFYSPHVCDEYGIADSTLKMWQLRDSRFPEHHTDEISRSYWYEEQLEIWDAILAERDEQKEAGPRPQGRDDQGRPYRYLRRATDRADGLDASGRAYQLLPADSYWARSAAGDA
ncbi:hypothetical protein [Streptomyces decoyicus]|uniref:hypothetical protein n=1 Tax=Streptomyces decoyicus TaxID=249567 RepID=UPI0036471A58